jgi:hypothetical protein
VPTNIGDMVFAQKVHHMVSSEADASYITWMPHGRAFKILFPSLLEKEALQKYFGHSRYSKFLTELKRSGFKPIASGTDRGCYYHEVRKGKLLLADLRVAYAAFCHLLTVTHCLVFSVF